MRSVATFILFVLYFSSAKSAENYAFTPIDANNGLSGNKVRNITQLPDGRMVITTEGLVNIYYGSAFEYLHFSDRNSIKLSRYSGFHHDYVSRGGYMWLKNQYRLFLIDLNKEEFANNPGYLLRSWGVTEPLSDFFMDRENNIWLITERDDLYLLPEGQKKIRLFRHNISKLAGGNDQVYDLALLNNKVYLFYQSGQLICFNLDSKKELYRQQSLNNDQGPKYAATSFVVSGKKQFLQLRNGTGGGIMLSYDVTTRKWNTVLKTSYWLNYISFAKGGEVWVTCRDGLWSLNESLSRKTFIPKLKLVDGQIFNTEVSTIYHDNQGGMWLGTLNRGLLYYHPDRFKFKNIGKALFPVSSDASLNVSCFAELGNGEVALGTRQGLFRYSEGSGLISRHPTAGNLQCNALLRDSNNRLWIATNGGGLFCLDAKGILHSYPSAPKTLNSIQQCSRSSFLLCSDGAGFGDFEIETGKYLQAAASKISHYRTVFQLVDLDKERKVGICREGFFVYNTRSGRVKLFPDSRGYNAVLVDNNKRVWLGSQDGLHLWNPETERKYSFFTSNGLINNYVQSLTQTPDGSIWISTSSGLSRLTTATDKAGKEIYSFKGFNRVDGVIANGFWERAVHVGSTGKIFWGGTDGFNILDPNRIFDSKQTHVPLFVNFLLFNKKIRSGEKYDENLVLKQALPLTKEIILNHDQNFISLKFSALNYINPTQTYYRYQLLGLDEKEQELQSADGRGSFNYTNLQPGTYFFKVRAADNSKDWTDKYTEIKIIVKAPLWKTRLAYAVYVFVALATLILAVRLYLLRKRKKLLFEQQEKLNEMKSAFLQNINKEMNEPLVQIIDPLENIIKHTDEGRIKVKLREVQNNALDMRDLLSQLSEGILSPVVQKESALNMEVLLLNMRMLLELQNERLQQNEDKVGTNINESLWSPFDEKLIQRALKYVEENLDNPGYSVELLSKDLGMDRTGLYRKLVHVIGKTPTSFIRSVRLKRAARLLEEGLSVAEVADRVGFSTSSYLTKCFQEEFGMKPTQYVASFKQKKSS